MLHNYCKDEWGVIHQKEIESFTYNKSYVEQGYMSLGNKITAMSHLRLGYIRGVLRHVPKAILDVGYGTGDFLNVCAKMHMTTHGCDLFDDLLPSHAKFVSDPCVGQYDLITFFDSLEHMHNLEFVSDLNTKFICISVPWCHSHTDDVWFQDWKHRKPHEHVHHFDQDSLRAFMQHHGYICLDYSNVEDVIRLAPDHNPNILTAVFQNTRC